MFQNQYSQPIVLICLKVKFLIKKFNYNQKKSINYETLNKFIELSTNKYSSIILEKIIENAGFNLILKFFNIILGDLEIIKFQKKKKRYEIQTELNYEKLFANEYFYNVFKKALWYVDNYSFNTIQYAMSKLIHQTFLRPKEFEKWKLLLTPYNNL